MFGKKKVPYFLIPCLLLAGILSARVLFSEKTEDISLRFFDRYQQLKPRVYQDAPVRFIDIDDESLSKLGQWPWPRTQMAELIQKLADNGASAIVLDILFAEPDRTSPVNILPFWSSDLPELKALQSQAKKLPDHDRLLAETISKTPVITGFTLTAETSSSQPAAPAIKSGFAHSGRDPLNYLPAFQGFIPNLPVIEAGASGSGSFNFLADKDGVLRRVPLIFRYKNQLIPSLAAESLRVAQGASSVIIKSSGASGELSYGAETGITSIKIGQFEIPTDSQGRMWLYDTGKIPARYLSAWKVMDGSAEAALIEGNIVFIGSSAAGLKDLRTTPLNPVTAGTEIHVQLAEQILHQNFLNRPDWAPGAELVFLLLLSAFLIFLLPRLGAALCAVLSLAAVGSAFGFSWYAFTQNHWLLDPITPSAAVFMIYLTVSLMNYLRVENEKSQVRHAFGRYVSHDLLERISEHPEQLKLGGEIRPMTILFSDIRNFTAISEKYSAEELTSFINRYLTPMTDIILKHNGTIDKYIGDCIMAFWNAPLTNPKHAQDACAAAIEMLEHLKSWNHSMAEEARREGKIFSPISVGIGLNTGECCVGNLGSNQRFDYSVLGDDVNLASRLEGQSKYYGVEIIIGENTQTQAQHLAALELDLIRVHGKQRPSKIYALLGGAALKESAAFKHFASKHAAFLETYRKKNWMDAEKLAGELHAAAAEFKLQNLYLLYQERIKEYSLRPPASGWDGVYTAGAK